MAGKGIESASGGVAPFLQLGKERTDAMLDVQRQLLDEYEEAGRMWLARVKSEVELWTELAKKVAASRTVPEGLDAYRDCVVQRMRMAAEDGLRLFEDGQRIVAAMTKAAANSGEKPK